MFNLRTVRMELVCLDILVVLLVLLESSGLGSMTCIFPREMYDTEYNWRIQSKDPEIDVPHRYRSFLFEVSDLFIVNYIRTYSPGDVVMSHTYRCVEQMTSNKYLVERGGEHNSAMYMCIQFVVRDLNVVQWKLSKRSAQSEPSLCDDAHLSLQDAPLIYYHDTGFWREARNKNTTYKPCPLDGGYVVKSWVDPRTSSELCPAGIPPLKLESECERGEGLRFNLFQENGHTCEGQDKHNILNQDFQCLASWTEGRWRFSILVKAYDEWEIYCLRQPQDAGQEFTMHVFMDGICDSTDTLAHSSNYRVALLHKYPVKNICADESPSCFSYRGKDCDFPEAGVCRQSCDVCSVEDVGVKGVTFPVQYQGTWIKETSRLGRDEVVIDGTTIAIRSLGSYRIVGDSICDHRLSGTMMAEPKEYMMLSEYSNGCSPRTSGLILASRSPAVLSYRMSRPAISKLQLDVADDLSWEVKNEMWSYACEDLSYGSDADPIYDTYRAYRGGWYNLVQASADAPRVFCDFPFNMTRRSFAFISQENIRCYGDLILYNDPLILSDDYLRTRLYRCEYPHGFNKSQHVTISGQSFKYECLATFQADEDITQSSRSFFITRSPKAHSIVGVQYLCWIYIPEEDLFYWTHISDCDANTEHHIEAQFKRPLATITFDRETSAASHWQPSLITIHVLLLTMCKTWLLT